MKIRNILYISAIMLLAGCSKDADISNSTLSGNGEKTPLLINATLDTGKGQTRAIGDTFEDGDVLKAYVRHTTNAGGVGHYTYLSNDPSSYGNKLVTINKDGTNFISNSYWDDFSLNNNLKAANHGLQAYYGYCYNHGSASTEIVETTTTLTDTDKGGTFTWQVQIDQNQTDGSGYTNAKKSDVLWASEQASVTYDHSTAHAGAGVNHGTLNLPFCHAMCEITVTVTAAVGFDGSNQPLDDTELILNKMNYESVLTARTKTISPLVQTDDNKLKSIKMYSESYTSPYTVRHFTAIVAPGTKIVKDAIFLTINNADGNYYEVKVNDEMLSTAAEKWGNGLTGEDQIVADNYIVTQPGKNYHLDITIDKSAVQVSASLADWSTVTATGTGAIKFTDDVTVTTPSSGFNNASAFSLFWVKHDDSHDTPAERTNTAYSYATTSTYDSGTGKWTNSPNLYWPNKNDSYYYRALATYSSGSIEVASPSITTTARGDAENKQTDGITTEGYILWGTTSGGTAISPRTGGVPMEFRVVNKSNVKFTLKTATSDAAMTLSEATISISNIYSTGNINLEDGLVDGTGAPGTLTPALNSDGGAETYSTASTPVLAQKISDDAVVTIAFKKDATEYSTFKIRLKDCVSGGSTPITVWEGGHTYNYTIHVEKEAVKFSAAVKPWTTVSGSGTATMVDE